MNARRPSRFAAGIVIWLSIAGGFVSLAVARSTELAPPAERILRFVAHGTNRVEHRFEAVPKLPEALDEIPGFAIPTVGDPVFAGDERVFVGAIAARELDTAAVGTPAFTITIALDPEYDPADLDDAAFAFEAADRRPKWVLDTLLPPRKREHVKRELKAYAKAHEKEIEDLLHPIEDQVAEHAWHVLEENLVTATKNHEKEIDALLDRYRSSLKDDVLPILKEELGPSAREKAKPILTKIGRECWDELPMWQGVGAYFRDKLPWQNKKYIDEWWQEFLDNKAIPILKEHEEELVKAGEDLVKEGFKDPKVRTAVNAELKKLANDPEFRKLLRTILDEALVHPFDATGLATKILEDPGNQERWRKLELTLDPVLAKVGSEIAIEKRPDGRDGLSPELARVIRRIVFNKDARWVTVTPKRPLVPRTARR